MNPNNAVRCEIQTCVSRRRFSVCVAACVAGCFAAFAANPDAVASDGQQVQLIRDPDFQRGFQLLRPEPGKKVPCGIARGPDPDPVIWNLAQWSSRFPFDKSTAVTQTADGARQMGNPARRVRFGDPDGVLTLAVDTGVEYGDVLRRKDQPWVHLLVSQRFDSPPTVGQLSALRLTLSGRLIRSVEVQPKQDPRIHAAHCLMFLTIQNMEKGNPGYGDLLWFGIPIYDNRTRHVRTYAAQDFAGTGKFIFTPAPAPPASPNIHDGDWSHLDLDLLPRIREGVNLARDRGYLQDLEDVDAYRVTGMNLGWEMPGTYDVEIQIRGLRLLAVP